MKGGILLMETKTLKGLGLDQGPQWTLMDNKTHSEEIMRDAEEARIWKIVYRSL